MASELLYDPDVGRFINQDTYLGENGTPPSLHRYLYAYNNPNLYTDPDGHSVAGMDMDRSGFRHTLPEKFNRPEHEAIRDAGDKGGAIGGALVIGAVTGGLSISACAVSGVCSGLSLLGGTAASLSDPDVDSLIPSGKITKNTSQVIDVASEATQKSKKSLNATPTKENKSGSVEGPQQSKNKNKEDSATNNNCVCRSGCFAAGTPVVVMDGFTSIEQLNVGDLVASKDEITGFVDWKRVKHVFIFNGRPIYQLTVENKDGLREVVTVTDDHPYWIVGKGWIKTIDLLSGMIALDMDDREVEIVSLVDLHRQETTYNIEVEDFHTFFVGELRTWVHNNDKLSAEDLRNIDKLGKRRAQVDVDSVGKARQYVDELERRNTHKRIEPNRLPNPDGRTSKSEGFADNKGTTRGDLINKADPDGNVHPKGDHKDRPHFNVRNKDGTSSAIMINDADNKKDQLGTHEPKSKEQLRKELERRTRGSNYQSNQNEPPCKCK